MTDEVVRAAAGWSGVIIMLLGVVVIGAFVLMSRTDTDELEDVGEHILPLDVPPLAPSPRERVVRDLALDKARQVFWSTVAPLLGDDARGQSMIHDVDIALDRAVAAANPYHREQELEAVVAWLHEQADHGQAREGFDMVYSRALRNIAEQLEESRHRRG
jgi:hypothetical protein